MRIDRIKFCAITVKKDLTFVRLSEISGVSKQTLSYIKQGKRCSEKTALKIAKALNVDIHEILEEGQDCIKE